MGRVGPRTSKMRGRRVNIYLPPESDIIAKDIDNLSEFVQVSLGMAAGIMAFDIIKREKGLVDKRVPSQEQIAEWNHNHPLDPLTAKRLGKTRNGPISQPVLGNPALDN